MMNNMFKMCNMDRWFKMFNNSGEKTEYSDFFGSRRNGTSEQSENKVTAEIRSLYEDWVRQVTEEVRDFLRNNSSADAKEVAQQMKISESSALYFIVQVINEM